MFSGPIQKSDPSLANPDVVVISWYNFVEGDDVRDGTAFRHVGGMSHIEVWEEEEDLVTSQPISLA